MLNLFHFFVSMNQNLSSRKQFSKINILLNFHVNLLQGLQFNYFNVNFQNRFRKNTDVLYVNCSRTMKQRTCKTLVHASPYSQRSKKPRR
jgi:hypothetical protein